MSCWSAVRSRSPRLTEESLQGLYALVASASSILHGMQFIPELDDVPASRPFSRDDVSLRCPVEFVNCSGFMPNLSDNPSPPKLSRLKALRMSAVVDAVLPPGLCAPKESSASLAVSELSSCPATASRAYDKDPDRSVVVRALFLRLPATSRPIA